MKLTIELIPQTAWGDNLRNYVGVTKWNKIKKQVYKNANYHCEICGGQGNKHPVECHERWKFENNKIILLGLIALCPSCHEVKHIGRAQATGNLKRAFNHFKKVNNITDEEAMDYIEKCFKLYHARSVLNWTLDLDILQEYL